MDLFQKYRLGTDMAREVAKKLNLYDVTSFCSTGRAWKKKVCNQTFWREYFQERYPKMIIYQNKAPVFYQNTKYSAKKIVDLFEGAKSENLKNYFPYVSPELVQSIADQYADDLFDFYLFNHLDYEVGAYQDLKRHYLELKEKERTLEEEDELEEIKNDLVELEEISEDYRVLLKPEQFYLGLGKTTNRPNRAPLSFFLRVVKSPTDTPLDRDPSSLIIGEVDPVLEKISINYSSQIEKAPSLHPDLTLSEYYRDEIEIPSRDNYSNISPKDPIEQIAKNYFREDLNKGIYLPLDFTPKTYTGRVTIENH